MDIDIKLRACKGSCQRYSEYQVDQESYVALDKQVRDRFCVSVAQTSLVKVVLEVVLQSIRGVAGHPW